MSTASEPIALFDLDATLANFEAAMNEQMSKLAGPNEGPELWNCDRDAMPDYIQARRSLIKKLPGFWENLPAIFAGFEVFRLVGELGFERHILTKGPERSTAAWTEKVHWCQRNVPDASITITQDKGLVYGRVLCDDWPPYVKRWLEWRPRGLVVMLDWPHNQGFHHPNVFRFRQDLPGDRAEDQMIHLKDRLIEARDR